MSECYEKDTLLSRGYIVEFLLGVSLFSQDSFLNRITHKKPIRPQLASARPAPGSWGGKSATPAEIEELVALAESSTPEEVQQIIRIFRAMKGE